MCLISWLLALRLQSPCRGVSTHPRAPKPPKSLKKVFQAPGPECQKRLAKGGRSFICLQLEALSLQLRIFLLAVPFWSFFAYSVSFLKLTARASLLTVRVSLLTVGSVSKKPLNGP